MLLGYFQPLRAFSLSHHGGDAKSTCEFKHKECHGIVPFFVCSERGNPQDSVTTPESNTSYVNGQFAGVHPLFWPWGCDAYSSDAHVIG